MSLERCEKHQHTRDTDFVLECPMCEEELQYDDVFPVSRMGLDLLDKHNELLATFDKGIEKHVMDRIVNRCNNEVD